MSEPSCSERRALVAETRAVLDELASGGAVTRDVVVALDGTARRLLNWIEAMNGRILELEGELLLHRVMSRPDLFVSREEAEEIARSIDADTRARMLSDFNEFIGHE